MAWVQKTEPPRHNGTTNGASEFRFSEIVAKALFQKQLRMLAGDVAYELNMFAFAVTSLERADLPDPSPERNLLEEGAAIHSRNLLEFFHEDKKRDDDLRPVDFMEGHDWSATKPEWVQGYMIKRHKLVAHLTTNRADYAESNNKDLDFRTALEHVMVTWKQFIGKLNPERRDWFESQLRSYAKALL